MAKELCLLWTVSRSVNTYKKANLIHMLNRKQLEMQKKYSPHFTAF